MRRRFVTAVLLVCLGAFPAAARLTSRDLEAVGFHLVPGGRLPLGEVVHDPAGDTTLGKILDGKPALLAFTDYRCQSLCGIILDELAETLPKMPLVLGRDYNLVSVALDSSQTSADATVFWDRHTAGSPLHDGGRYVTEGQSALQAIEQSVGLVAPRDDEEGRFAHPAGLVLVDASGRAQRVLSALALDPFNLKLALTETGASPASVVGHALLLCYGLDAQTGLYTLRIQRVLALAAGVTALLLGCGVGLLIWQDRRRSA